MRARNLALAALAAALACAPKFAPRSVIENLRVLAIVATPLELSPGSSVVTLSARTVTGDGRPAGPGDLREQWSFCPFSLGASVGYACASGLPACDFHFPPGVAPAGFDALAQAQACLAALGVAGGLPSDVPPDLSAVQKLDLVFRYQASDGVTDRAAVQTVPLYRTAPVPANTAPVIARVLFCGNEVTQNAFTWPAAASGCTLAPGGQVEIRVQLTEGSAEPYTDASGSHVESPVVSFYTTAGRFDFDRANGPDAVVKLEYKEIGGPGTALIYAVARDLRGGETVTGPYGVVVQ